MLARAVAVVTLAASVAACGGSASTGPPEFRAGIDVCNGCGMTVSDTRCGATLHSLEDSGERWLVFDDIECLLRWEAAHRGGAAGTRFLRDHARDTWTEASAATLVRADASLTPMGSGLLAFSDQGEAEAFARESNGKTLVWAEAVVDEVPR